MTMKALIAEQYGAIQSLRLKEVAVPTLGKDELLIRIRAAGVNFPDSLMVTGKYQTKPPLPFAPGFECAGEVEKVGEGVSGFNVGDRVFACTPWGSYAEKVCVPSYRVFPMPTAMDFKTAAGFPVIYGTAYHALKQRANLKAGETLLVLGASGGIGTAAVQLGKAMGATVIAAAGTEAKLKFAKENGADFVFDYQTTALKAAIKQLTNEDGIDVVIDPVGGALTEQALRACRWGGRLLVVGFAGGTIPQLPLNLALLKSAAIVGVHWSTFLKQRPLAARENFNELMQLYLDKKIVPMITHVLPLSAGAQAMELLSERRAFGKIVLDVSL